MKNVKATALTRKTIDSFYAALKAKDTDQLAAVFAPSIDWYVPGEKMLAPWVGSRNRSEEVKEFFELLFNNIESISFSFERLLIESDFGVATGCFVSKMITTGAVYKSPFSARFRVRNGLIIYYRFLEDSNGLVKALTLYQDTRG